MNEFYILMGSNINPDDNIKLGIKEIESHSGLTIVKKSSFYESEPYGMEGDNFLNLVLNIQTNNNFSYTNLSLLF